MKIGVMGGTFDPVHFGHIKIAEEVTKEIGLNEVLFLPSGNPAHKKDKKVTPANIRYEMLAAAAEGFPDFKISDIEIKREGYTYTIDTLRELHKILPAGTEIIYIIGADVVAELDTWRDYKEDFKLCRFAAVLRPGYSKEFFNKSIDKMKALGADIIPVTVSQINISSSEIRHKIMNKIPVEGLMPDKVIEIIKRENLYNE